MKLSMSKTREQFPLSEKKITKKTVTFMMGWTALLGVVYIFLIIIMLSTSTEPFSILLGTAGLMAVIFLFLFLLVLIPTYLYQKWYFAFYFYDLTPDNIVIRKSPITPKEITIPYERIQDIYVDQDILDRVLRIYDVHLSSATATSGMEAHIDGVEKQAADGLRAALLKIVGEKISKKNHTAPVVPVEVAVPIPPVPPVPDQK